MGHMSREEVQGDSWVQEGLCEPPEWKGELCDTRWEEGASATLSGGGSRCDT